MSSTDILRACNCPVFCMYSLPLNIIKFIRNSGGQPGTGTGPIRDPNTGQPGYEDNSGKFHLGNAPGSGGGGSSSRNADAEPANGTSATLAPGSGAKASGSTSGTSRSTDGTSGFTGGTSGSTGTLGSGKGKHGSGASGTGKVSSGADQGAGTGGRGTEKHSPGTGVTHSGVGGDIQSDQGSTRNKIKFV